MKRGTAPTRSVAVWPDVGSMSYAAWLRAVALRPQPSLRIPVTPANRECLRRLRIAEAEAWESTATSTAQTLS
ncbi:MAG TPA: hypothetical protein P5525_15300 [Candidatus Paceibacterota bacterium]|nr:hypothetical protein [Candidatus Paceibacterota bacterium]